MIVMFVYCIEYKDGLTIIWCIRRSASLKPVMFAISGEDKDIRRLRLFFGVFSQNGKTQSEPNQYV